MKIKIIMGTREATAILNGKATTTDFVSLLPLTVILDDYNNTEKVITLVRRLGTKDAPEGFTPVVGDIAYYAPWGNLALFYKDFEYSNGLISLGKITSGAEIFQTPGSLKVTIELHH